MKPSRHLRVAALVMLAGSVLATEFAPVVEAIVGAPRTPVSVAGVARRTARRTTVVVASSTPAPATAPPASGMVASLPSGCEASGELFRCGNIYYRPYMQGSTVVYAKVSGQ